MAKFNYTSMKLVADDLLNKFGQGVVTITRVTQTPAANSWDAPTLSTVTETVDAVVSGVANKYVDGSTILATDLNVTMALPNQYSTGDVVNIDGKPVTILQTIPIPAAGNPVVLKLIVRR